MRVLSNDKPKALNSCNAYIIGMVAIKLSQDKKEDLDALTRRLSSIRLVKAGEDKSDSDEEVTTINLNKLAVRYLYNGGSSVLDVARMASDGPLIRNYSQAVRNDKKYLQQVGFSEEAIKNLGQLTNIAVANYDSRISQDKFASQLRSAIAYLVTKGTSAPELREMASKGTLISNSYKAFVQDSINLLNQGFTPDQINKLEFLTAAVSSTYEKSMGQPDEFLDTYGQQLTGKLKLQESDSLEPDLEQQIEGTPIDWKPIAARAAMFALYAGGAALGTYVLLGDVSGAQGETIQTYWAHHGDITGEGITDYNDLKCIADHWLSTDHALINNYSDLNGDDIVNFTDFAILARDWKWEKPSGAVMEAYVTKVTSTDEDPPYCGIRVEIYNISPEDNFYDMKEATFNSGKNNGVNDVYPYDGWNEDHETDPNVTRTWKDTGNYIRGGQSGLFQIYAVGNPGEDPNDFKNFKRDYVNAKTRLSEVFDFPPLIFDLPDLKK